MLTETEGRYGRKGLFWACGSTKRRVRHHHIEEAWQHAPRMVAGRRASAHASQAGDGEGDLEPLSNPASYDVLPSACASLSEDPDSVPASFWWLRVTCDSIPGDLMASFCLQVYQACTWYTYMKTKHSYV